MANKYLDNNGLSYLWQKIKSQLTTKVDKVDGKGLSTNDYTTAEKTKLAGIAEGANKITVDSALNSTSTNPVQNKVINTALGNKVDKISGKGLSSNDFTTDYKNKLDGIEEGATAITVDTTLSSTSTNPVQNKVINTALDNKVDKISGKGLSTNDYTNAEKNKLAALKTQSEMDATYVSSITIDGVSQRISSGVATLDLSNYAKKADISGLFEFKGTAAVVPPLTQCSYGAVYNISAEFTTDSDFVEGAGNVYPAGTNIVVVDADTTGASPTKKWDVLGGFVDLSPYMKTSDMVAITNTEIDQILAS